MSVEQRTYLGSRTRGQGTPVLQRPSHCPLGDSDEAWEPPVSPEFLVSVSLRPPQAIGGPLAGFDRQSDGTKMSLAEGKFTVTEDEQGMDDTTR